MPIFFKTKYLLYSCMALSKVLKIINQKIIVMKFLFVLFLFNRKEYSFSKISLIFLLSL